MTPCAQLRLYPGWASTAGVWDPVRPHLQQQFELLDQGRPHDPSRPLILLGWSLGGWEVLAGAAREAGAAAVLLVACNPSFVRRPGWPQALAPGELEDFCREFSSDAPATLRRFTALQALGDERAGEVRRLLRAEGIKALELDPTGVARGLERLCQEDWRAAFAECTVPLGVILGREDRLVPASVAAAMGTIRPGLWLEVIERTAHAPFISRPEVFTACCVRFLRHALAEEGT